MDINTGKIHEVSGDEHLDQLQKELNTKLIPLTEKQATTLKPLSNHKRKWLINHGECICGSGKTFKKCCLKKYKNK